MKHLKLHHILLLWAILISACNRFEGDYTSPSYITIDAISVENTPGSSWSYYDGFFNSEINTANIEIYFEGDTAVTNLGAYTLPCKVPLLREGVAKYVDITPVVKQNGIANSRIRYPYYNNIKIENVRLTLDSVTNLGSLVTRYNSNTKVVWKEHFEPQSFSFLLDPDSLITTIDDVDTVCDDYGCGVIRVRSDQNKLNFWIDEPVRITDKTAYTYLELNYRSDIPFAVGFNNPDGIAESNVLKYAMTINPCDHWQKMYINLGKLWADYNYYPDIRLYFTVLNDFQQNGNIYLDNMKIVVL